MNSPRDRKSMSVLVAGQDKKQRLLVKGAPESILERCTSAIMGATGKVVPLNGKVSQLINEEVKAFGSRGWRVIALAVVDDVSQNPLIKDGQDD